MVRFGVAAIYQTARPSTFAEVVGQEHVREILSAALAKNRVGHAYLFSGPRGVGKTTTARLLAMAVNCEGAHETARPCGTCASCAMVRQGSHPDVTELDAASHNSVDDVREIRERVRLASLHGGKRVWILDEAHMLSGAAANALLKTLEEPPPGLVFVLATTEPERLPATVLSRCQHFRFRRLTSDEIRSKLARLCADASVEAQTEALDLMARASEGAMRDAESTLERLWATGLPITTASVEEALGLPPSHRIETLARAVLHGDVAAIFDSALSFHRDGFAPRSVVERVAQTLRDALRRSVTGEDGFVVDASEDDQLHVLAAIDDELPRFVRHSDLYSLEAALLKAARLVRTPPSGSVHVTEATAAGRPEPATGPTELAEAVDAAGNGASDEGAPTSRGPVSTQPLSSASTTPSTLRWHDVKSRANAQLNAFLRPAEDSIDGSTLVLTYDDRFKFHRQQIEARLDDVVRLVREVAGDGWSVRIEAAGGASPKKR